MVNKMSAEYSPVPLSLHDTRTIGEALDSVLADAYRLTDSRDAYGFLAQLLEQTAGSGWGAAAFASVILEVNYGTIHSQQEPQSFRIRCGNPMPGVMPIEPVTANRLSTVNRIVELPLPDGWNLADQSPAALRTRAAQTRAIVLLIRDAGVQRSIESGDSAYAADAYDAYQPYDQYADWLIHSAELIDDMQARDIGLRTLGNEITALMRMDLASDELSTVAHDRMDQALLGTINDHRSR